MFQKTVLALLFFNGTGHSGGYFRILTTSADGHYIHLGFIIPFDRSRRASGSREEPFKG
jgi:hypothetical protein